MAATTKQTRMGRRVMPKVRRHGTKGSSLTLGEIVAAVYEVSGGDTEKAMRLLNSRELAQALGRRIVVG